MGLRDILSSVFKTKTADPARSEIVLTGGAAYAPVETNARLQRLALGICIDYIASAVGKCEFRTFLRGQEVRGEEYYLWNVAPNPTQTSTEFWREVITRLYNEREVLIVPVGGALIIADGFSTEERAVAPTLFTNVSRGDFYIPRVLTSETAIHLTLPGELTPAALTSGVTDILEETLSEAVDKYMHEGGEKGTFEYDADRMGDDDYNRAVNQALEEDFANYYSAKSAVLPIYAGMKYNQFTNSSGQKNSIVGDINSIMRQALTVAAQSVKIAPALILGEVADTKSAVDNMLTFCLDPLLDMITESINSVRYGRAVLDGSFIQADTSCIKHVDALSIAGDLDKLKSAGLFSTNEIRRKIGEPRINSPWADEYSLTKNYENIPGSGTGTTGEDEREEEDNEDRKQDNAGG